MSVQLYFTQVIGDISVSGGMHADIIVRQAAKVALALLFKEHGTEWILTGTDEMQPVCDWLRSRKTWLLLRISAAGTGAFEWRLRAY